MDKSRIKKSKFLKLYKNLKNGIGVEQYWEDRTYNMDLKGQWARLKCVCVGREKEKGFKKDACRICKRDRETIEKRNKKSVGNRNI